VTKTSHSQPLQHATASVQPWIRDHYTALRAEAAPRLQQTRAVVVPVIMDTSHKVRDDLVPRVRDELVPKVRDEYIPAAAQMSSRMAEEAMHRSAPLRAELSDRATATFAAARGQLNAAQLGQLGQLKRGHKGQNQKNSGHSHRKLWFIGAAATAAIGAAVVLWQRSRYHAWVEDDATQNTMSDTPEPERLNSNDPNTNHNHSSDAENGGANVHTPSTGQHEDEQQ
jgi:hypothetical protein